MVPHPTPFSSTWKLHLIHGQQAPLRKKKITILPGRGWEFASSRTRGSYVLLSTYLFLLLEVGHTDHPPCPACSYPAAKDTSKH